MFPSEVVGDCLIRQQIGLALQPTRVAFLRRLCDPQTRHEPGVSGGGLCICGEPSASQSHWSELASEGSPSFSLVVSSVIGVYTCAASRCVSAPCVSHLGLHPLEDDREARVESLEEFAHAWDVVVHSGCCLGTDFSRFLLQGLPLADQTPAVCLVQPSGLRGSHAVWQLVSRRDE